VVLIGLISLKSVTYAYKARNYLENAGIKSYVVKTPKNLEKNGCSYSLKVPGDARSAARQLKNAGIPVEDVFQ